METSIIIIEVTQYFQEDLHARKKHLSSMALNTDITLTGDL